MEGLAGRSFSIDFPGQTLTLPVSPLKMWKLSCVASAISRSSRDTTSLAYDAGNNDQGTCILCVSGSIDASSVLASRNHYLLRLKPIPQGSAVFRKKRYTVRIRSDYTENGMYRYANHAMCIQHLNQHPCCLQCRHLLLMLHRSRRREQKARASCVHAGAEWLGVTFAMLCCSPRTHTCVIIVQDLFLSVEAVLFSVRRVATHYAIRVTLRQGITGLAA